MGLWVRDAAAGVGTLTFYEPSTGQFGALGHGINDVDTYELIDIANGELVDANIVEIVKGKNGTPGEIRGSLGETGALGSISKNTGYGVYENISDFKVQENGTETHWDSGKHRKTYRFSIDINTDNKVYNIGFEYDYENPFNTETLGVNRMVILNEERNILVLVDNENINKGY